VHLKTAVLFSFEQVADKKLTELTEHTAFNDNDKYYIVTSDGVSKFARHGVLIENLIAAIEAGSTDSKFRGYKENEAAIQAIPNPKDGDGAVNLVDNHFWIYIALDVYGNPLNEWVDTGQVVTPPEVDPYPTDGNFDKVPSSGGTFEKLAGKSDVGHGHSPSETWLQEILSFYVLTSEFLTPFWAALKSVLKEGDNITFQTNETTKTLTIHAAGGGGGGDPHFLGVYPSLYDLISEHPSASPGDFSDVDEGPGIDVIRYVWDDSDTQWKAGTTDSVPFASETVPGIVEQATESEFNTGTDVGGSGAPLFVPPSLIKAKFDAITVIVPNASETVKGVVEQATPSQFDAGTDTGETGAPLFVPPSLIKSKLDSVTIANASETVAGKTEEGTTAQVNDSVNTGTGETGARLFVSIPKLWAWFTFVLTQAWTWAGKQTFTQAIRLNSTTASKILKTDTNKDVVSGDLLTTDLPDMGALTILANATNATAKPTAVVASVAERVFVRTASNTLAFLQLTANYIAALAIGTGHLAANAVTRAKMSQSLAQTVIGNPTLVTADPSDWSVADEFTRTATATNYTVLATDRKVVTTSTAAARTNQIGFLISTVTDGHEIFFKDESGGAGTNNITIAPLSTDTIETGGTSIATNFGYVCLYANKTANKWQIKFKG